MENEKRVRMKNPESPWPLPAIRAKCLDCSGGMFSEVRECWAENCPLFPYRFGKAPKTAIRRLEKAGYKVELIK